MRALGDMDGERQGWQGDSPRNVPLRHLSALEKRRPWALTDMVKDDIG